MNQKKLLILSFNNNNIDFWRYHLELNDIDLTFSQVPANRKIENVYCNPDITLIDGYFTPTLLNFTNFKNIIDQVNSNGDASPYYLLSPIFSDPEEQQVREKANLKLRSFSPQFLKDIHRDLQS